MGVENAGGDHRQDQQQRQSHAQHTFDCFAHFLPPQILVLRFPQHPLRVVPTSVGREARQVLFCHPVGGGADHAPLALQNNHYSLTMAGEQGMRRISDPVRRRRDAKTDNIRLLNTHCHCEACFASRTPEWLLLPLCGNSPSGNPFLLAKKRILTPARQAQNDKVFCGGSHPSTHPYPADQSRAPIANPLENDLPPQHHSA